MKKLILVSLIIVLILSLATVLLVVFRSEETYEPLHEWINNSKSGGDIILIDESNFGYIAAIRHEIKYIKIHLLPFNFKINKYPKERRTLLKNIFIEDVYVVSNGIKISLYEKLEYVEMVAYPNNSFSSLLGNYKLRYIDFWIDVSNVKSDDNIIYLICFGKTYKVSTIWDNYRHRSRRVPLIRPKMYHR